MSERTQIAMVASTPIWQIGGAVVYATRLRLDADGSPYAYHPPTEQSPRSGHPPGLDLLANACTRTGTFFGVATSDKERKIPIVQQAGDPAPGFYISTTALCDRSGKERARRYVDSEKIPFIVLPGKVAVHGESFRQVTGLRLGDLAIIWWRSTYSFAIAADIGPSGKIGEGSIALARALGFIPPGTPRERLARSGHSRPDIVHVVFRDSAAKVRWPREVAEMKHTAEHLFEIWGGQERLASLYPNFVHRNAIPTVRGVRV